MFPCYCFSNNIDLFESQPCREEVFTEEYALKLFHYFKNNKEPVEICLNGDVFLVLSPSGGGTYSQTFRIREKGKQEQYILKIYYDPSEQKGDLLAQRKIRYAKNLVSVPLYVDMEKHYSVFNVLYTPWEKTYYYFQEKIMGDFDQILHPLLRKDGLTLGDNLNPGNYMVASPRAYADVLPEYGAVIIDGESAYKLDSGIMKRIDFGTLKEIR